MAASIPEETLALHLVSAASGQFEKCIECIGSLGHWVPNIATKAMESAFPNPFRSSRKHWKDIPLLEWEVTYIPKRGRVGGITIGMIGYWEDPLVIYSRV